MEKTRVAAGGILIHENGTSFCVALLEDSHNCWVLPKGHVVEGETKESAALREVREELGINKKLNIAQFVGNSAYKYTQKGAHFHKTVDWFLLKSSKPLSLTPLTDENFINAKWVKFDKAIKILSYPKERAMFIRATFLQLFTQIFKKNLFSIILCGSNSGLEKKDVEEWGDIDLLVVFNSLDLKTKQQIAEVALILEKATSRRISIDVVAKHDFLSPQGCQPLIKGKVLQSLIELNIFPDRIIYLQDSTVKIHYPKNSLIAKFSLFDIGQSISRNRRVLSTTKLKKNPDLKKIVEKEISASFIITKLIIQQQQLITATSKKDTIGLAKKYFHGFDFKTLEENLLSIEKWSQIHNEKDLMMILKRTDNFIEEFSKFIFEKLLK